MNILTSSSSSKIVLQGGNRFLSSRGDYLSFVNRHVEICAFDSKKAISNVRFLDLVSVQRRPVKHVFASSSLPPESEMYMESVEPEIHGNYETKTVQIKFRLQKQCSFGEQFFMAGDDPMFGVWDPECAIPMNWSAEHVWTVNLDIPVDKPILYKFILKSGTGNILWQPGPDRVFMPWNTEKSITVSEDWEDAALQKIMEESEISIAENQGYEKVKMNDDVGKQDSLENELYNNIFAYNDRPVTEKEVEGEAVLLPGLSPLMSAESQLKDDGGDGQRELLQ